ncbi:MAG: heavy metal translocating P-type ATPase [Bacteroides sp.]|nr:heavy metal translocating P-type ATPase [Prevotella sp.]MCM1407675.1 heavy metal translocating P-type ATPase [Treponema brennaborense]MCM1469175.1 heavy metal translocating P-type ATPase [Bacteroides sp.]
MNNRKDKEQAGAAPAASANAANAVCIDNHNHAVHEHKHEHEHEHHHEHKHGCCGHCCHDGGEHEESLKTKCIRLICVAVLFAAAVCAPNFPLAEKSAAVLKIVLFAAAYLAAGGDVLLNAAKNIIHGEIFDENFLMCIATLGAFAIGEYPECIGVMVFYQIGEAFQDYAVGKSRKSVAALMDIRPDTAHIVRGDTEETIAAEKICAGDIVRVHPGERVPADGTIISGESFIDASSLTGESVPFRAGIGNSVLSGYINGGGVLTVKIEKPYAESTASKILELTEHAASRKASVEKFITRFARYYTPAVCAAALIIAVVPPLYAIITGAAGEAYSALFSAWMYRALVFLVVSCPCALVISVPLSFFGGIGAASRNGILIKGSSYLELLAKAGIAVFDKTGTLTKGEFEVTMTHVAEGCGMTAAELRAVAAHVEYYSSHPVSVSLKKAHINDAAAGLSENASEAAVPECCKNNVLSDVSEIAGCGIKGCLNGRNILAGNSRLMESHHVDGFSCEKTCAECAENGGSGSKGTVVHVAVDGQYAGHIVISDTIKPDAAAALAELKKAGIKKTVILTGDSQKAAEETAAAAGADEICAELLPDGKVEQLERLYKELPSGMSLIFTGDGINDAPVLARADVGIAMGALGSDAAIEAADVVIMDDKLSGIAESVRIARRTVKIARQNIVFSLGVKAVILIAGAAGIAGMWAAVVGDVGVSLLATLNAMRVLRFRGTREKAKAAA